MTHLLVGSEADMEHGLEYTVKLALEGSDEKILNISFPSETLMSIFMANLFKEFVIHRVPTDTGLNLTLIIPEKE